MYNNISEKLRGTASVLCLFGCTASFIVGLIFCVRGVTFESLLAFCYGALIISLGSLISWVLSLVVYGLGVLIDKSAETAELISKTVSRK